MPGSRPTQIDPSVMELSSDMAKGGTVSRVRHVKKWQRQGAEYVAWDVVIQK